MPEGYTFEELSEGGPPEKEFTFDELSAPELTFGEKVMSVPLGLWRGISQKWAPGAIEKLGMIGEIGPIGTQYATPDPGSVLEAEELRRFMRTPGELAKDIVESPIVAEAKPVREYWENAIEVTPAEKDYWLAKGAEEAGAMAEYLLPGAPLLIGAQSMADHIINDFEELKQNFGEEEAGRIAIERGLTSGSLQAGVFKFLPPKLKSVGERFIMKRFGEGAVSRFVGRRIAHTTETGALMTAAAAAENLASGRPAGEGLGEAFTGGAILGAITPRGEAPRKPKAPRPPLLPEEMARRKQIMLNLGVREKTKVEFEQKEVESDQVARTAKDGTVIVNEKNFQDHLEEELSEGKTVEQGIENIFNEEHIHSGVRTLPNGDAIAKSYWDNLTALEKAIVRRIYRGKTPKGEKPKELTDEEWGHEAIRISFQRLKKLEPGEHIFIQKGEPAEIAKSKALTAFLDIISYLRRHWMLKGTEAARRQLGYLDQVEQNLKQRKGAQDALVTETAPVLRPVREPSGEGAREVPVAERRAADDERRRKEGLEEKAQVPLEAKDAPLKGEVVMGAAYRAPDGTVHTGPHHPAALAKAGVTGFETRESRNRPEFGYVTNRRPFVSRDLGGRIAERTGQKIEEFEDPTQPHSDEIASAVQPGRTVAEQTPGAEKVPPAAVTGEAQAGQAPPGKTIPAAAAPAAGPAAKATISTTPSEGKPGELADLEARMREPGYQFTPEDLARQHELRQQWMRQRLGERKAERGGPAMIRKPVAKDVKDFSDRVRRLETVPTEDAVRAGLKAESMNDLDELLALNNDMRARTAKARETKDFDQAMMLSGRGQIPREAVEAAVNFGSHEQPGADKPLDWRKNPEIARWIVDHAYEMAWMGKRMDGTVFENESLPEVREFVKSGPAMIRKPATRERAEYSHLGVVDDRGAATLLRVKKEGQSHGESGLITGKRFRYDQANNEVVWMDAPTLDDTFAVESALEKLGIYPSRHTDWMDTTVDYQDTSGPAMIKKPVTDDDLVKRVEAIVPQGGAGEEISPADRPTVIANMVNVLKALPPEQHDQALTEFQAQVNRAIDAKAASELEVGIPPEIAAAKALGLPVLEIPELTTADINRGIFQNLNSETPDYKRYLKEFRELYPDIHESYILNIWNENAGIMLANMSKARAEYLRKLAGLDKGEHRGFISEPNLDPMLSSMLKSPKGTQTPDFNRFAASRGLTKDQAMQVLLEQRAAEYKELAEKEKTMRSMTPSEQAKYLEDVAKTISANNRRRAKLLGALHRWLVKQSKQPERDPMRREVGLDDINFETSRSNLGPYRTFTKEEASDYKFLSQMLWDGASVEGKTASKYSNRLVVVENPFTGSWDAVSLYRHPRSKEVMIYDPSGPKAGDKTKSYIPLKRILATYRIRSAMLLRDPVTNFHQRWAGEKEFKSAIGEVAERHENYTYAAWKEYQRRLARERQEKIEEERRERFEPAAAQAEAEAEQAQELSVREQIERQREAAGLRPWEEGEEPPGTQVERGMGGSFTGYYADVVRAAAGELKSNLRSVSRGPVSSVEADGLAKVFQDNAIKTPFDILKAFKRMQFIRSHIGWLKGEPWGLRGSDYCALSAIDKAAKFWYLRLVKEPMAQLRIAEYPRIPRGKKFADMTPAEQAHFEYREGLKYDALGMAINHIYEISEQTSVPAEAGRVSINTSAFRAALLDVYGETSRRTAERAAPTKEQAIAAVGRRISQPGVVRELTARERPAPIPLQGGVTAGKGPLFARAPEPTPMLSPQEYELLKQRQPPEAVPPGTAGLGYPYERPPAGVTEKPAVGVELPGELMRRAAQAGPRKPYVPIGMPWWEQMTFKSIMEESRVRRPDYRAAEEEGPAMIRKGYGISRRAREEMAAQGRAMVPLPPDSHMELQEQLRIGEQMWKSGVNPHDVMERVEQTGMMKPVDDLSLVRYWGRVLQRNADAIADATPDGVKSKEYDRALKIANSWQERIEKAFGEPIGRGLGGFRGDENVDTGSVTMVINRLKQIKKRDLTSEEELEAEDIADESAEAVRETNKSIAELSAEMSRPPELERGQAAVASAARQKSADARRKAIERLRSSETDMPAMAKKGEAAPPLTEQQLSDLVDVGRDVMMELSERGEYTDAKFESEMLKLVGRKYMPHMNNIRVLSEQSRMEFLNREIGTGKTTTQAVEALTRKRPTVEESKRAIAIAVAADPNPRKITPAEASHIWNIVRQLYLDKGVRDMNEIRMKATREIGIPVSRYYLALASKRSTRELSEKMLAKMRRERRVTSHAKNWIHNQKYPKWFRALRWLPRGMFLDKVAGHGFVPMITHASPMMFNPWASKIYFRAWRDMYHMVFSEKYHDKRMQDLREHERFDFWENSGLQINPDKYSDDYQIEELRRFLESKAGGKHYGKIATAARTIFGARSFDALKTLRMDYAEKWWDQVPDHLKTKEMGMLIADSVNHATGIVKTRFHEAWSWAAFAPRLESSRWAFIFRDTAKAGAIALKPGRYSPQERLWARQELAQKAAMAGMYFGALALNQGILSAIGSDQKINFTDPRENDFLAFKIAGFQVSVVSPFIGMLRMFADVLRLSRGELGPLERLRPRQKLVFERMGQYARGKASPFADIFLDIGSQQDPVGRPLPWSEDVLARSRRLRGVQPYEMGEWIEGTFSPIPVEEVVREVWSEMGMDEPTIERNLRTLFIGASTAFTGARVKRLEE